MVKFKDCEAPLTKLYLGRVVWYGEVIPDSIGHVIGFTRDNAGELLVKIQTSYRIGIDSDSPTHNVTAKPEQITLGE